MTFMHTWVQLIVMPAVSDNANVLWMQGLFQQLLHVLLGAIAAQDGELGDVLCLPAALGKGHDCMTAWHLIYA